MLPIVDVPQSIRELMEPFRPIFCRDAGFDHVSRYITGLILSPNKTLQGIYDIQFWDGKKPSRRSMHEAIFEAGWNSDGIMQRHRTIIAQDHHNNEREVISLDWTLCHHSRGPEIFGVFKGYDYVENCYRLIQNVMTATIANRNLIDGIEVIVQEPNTSKKEKEYLKATAKNEYKDIDETHERLLDLLHYAYHKNKYKQRTEIFVDMIRQIESENLFPSANYAFDNGVLSRPLTQLIEQKGKQWVSELESSRNIFWNNEWIRVDKIWEEVRHKYPESFRKVEVKCRNKKTKIFFAFTKVIRLKKYGKKRLVIVHEKDDLSDKASFFLSSAKHWESGRVIETWNYRWPAEIFHEFSKQQTGMEAAQVRNEESVKRHLRLSCVAQSFLQRVSVSTSTSEKFAFADGEETSGQRCRAIAREAFHSLLLTVESFLKEGKSTQDIREALMPA